jgi:putative N6-adenine-specific DNA methylase
VPAPLRFHAPCPRGLESLLADELRALGATILSQPGGGIRFEGDAAIGMAANLHSRLASRVLREVAQGDYRDERDLYELALQTPWGRWHDAQATARIDVTATRSPLQSLHFALQRIKDGLVDHHREHSGERPSMDTRKPDRRIFAHLDAHQATLYLDWSGDALFKRGWRREGFEAPLKENLAAGLLGLAGWTPDQPLFDPFCGSGTVVIEAADIASGRPPGARRRFAFERMRDFDPRLWSQIREASHAAACIAKGPWRAGSNHSGSSGDSSGRAQIIGSDISVAAIATAHNNLAAAGLAPDAVQLRQLDVLHLDVAPADHGLLVTNPPYGERLDLGGRQSLAQTDRFWPAFATLLKHRFPGWSACLLTSDPTLPKRMRLAETRRTPLFNGAIECRLFRFEIYAGSKHKTTTEPPDVAASVSETTSPK